MASITFDPNAGVPLSVLPAFPLVVRYSPGSPFRVLPNILCTGISRRCGADPGVVRFKYALDELNPPGFPDRIEDVLGLDKSGPYIASQDDRLCVVIPAGDGGYQVVADCFAQVPQGDLSPAGEDATFEAVGVGARCFDTPLAGSVYRNGPDVTVVSDVQTDRLARFNPDGRPNRVPAGAFSGAGTQKYPVFVDAATSETADATHAFWTVADVAAYILAQGNDEQYVTNPTLSSLASILCDRTQGGGLLDPAKQPATPIPCQDLEISDLPWPEALVKLLHPHSFDFAFMTSQSSSGTPLTYIYFFRTDDADNVAPKQLYLQQPGQALNPALSNFNAMGVARDGSRIANEIMVTTQCTHHEIGVILAPGFTPNAADATGASFPAFDTENPNFVPGNQDKYRVFVANESGDGYWDFSTSSWKTTPVCNFDAVFGAPQPRTITVGPPIPQYANHRRPGISTLFSLDGTKERRHAKLYISRDYAGIAPGIWDRSASWSPVESGWELLPDRLGVRITAPKISAIEFGPPVPGFGAVAVNSGAHISLVESINNPFTIVTTSTNPRVTFLLVCVVESDMGLGAAAFARPSSISQFSIQRRKDERDRFVKHVVCASSIFNVNPQDTVDPTAGGRDDTLDAFAYAEASRASSENPSFQGQFRIPWISGGYDVGDKISAVTGRNINLRTNGGFAGGEAAQYAVVTGIDLNFDPQQSTHIVTSDLRKEAMPPPEHQK